MYICYEYMDTFKNEPNSYDQLFGYLRYKSTKDTLRQAAEAAHTSS